MKEILYCTAGVTSFGVIKDEIIERNGFVIKAKRIFTMQPAPSRIARTQMMMDFVVAVYNNVEAVCNIICNLEPESQFYKGIMEGFAVLEKEGGKIQ